MKSNEILLVEDNPDDQLLARIALDRAHVTNRLIVASDGAEAIDYLLARGAFAERNRFEQPAVVLLDLNMPGMDGFEVLRLIRADEQTRCLPVVVFTTSNADEDLIKSYQLGCNSFIRKPLNFERFVAAINQLGLYWLILNESPCPLPVRHA